MSTIVKRDEPRLILIFGAVTAKDQIKARTIAHLDQIFATAIAIAKMKAETCLIRKIR